MSPFLIVWASIVGAAAVGTTVLSALTYAHVRRPVNSPSQTAEHKG